MREVSKYCWDDTVTSINEIKCFKVNFASCYLLSPSHFYRSITMNFWQTEWFLAKYMDEGYPFSFAYLLCLSFFISISFGTSFSLWSILRCQNFNYASSFNIDRHKVKKRAFERSLKIEQANVPLVMNFVREGSSISRNNLTIGSIIVRKGSADYKPFAKAVERCTMESRR